MKTRMALIEDSIAEYLMHLDRMDRKETPRNLRKAARLQERIATLKEEMVRLKGLKGLKRQMEASLHGQVSLTDPDAHSMASQGKGTGIAKAWDMEAFAKRAQQTIPLQRGGEPEEVVGAALYFATAASSYTTGAILKIDGGSAYPAA